MVVLLFPSAITDFGLALMAPIQTELLLNSKEDCLFHLCHLLRQVAKPGLERSYQHRVSIAQGNKVVCGISILLQCDRTLRKFVLFVVYCLMW